MTEILSSLKHPAEGIAYLFYISLAIRRFAPSFWNQLLVKMMVEKAEKIN
tara:strand:- start:43 stop:192 length:150 start_codon:yes stop_codon:yes gene_type:complete